MTFLQSVFWFLASLRISYFFFFWNYWSLNFPEIFIFIKIILTYWNTNWWLLYSINQQCSWHVLCICLKNSFYIRNAVSHCYCFFNKNPFLIEKNVRENVYNLLYNVVLQTLKYIEGVWLFFFLFSNAISAAGLVISSGTMFCFASYALKNIM